jgi:hypothetical protein
MKTHHLLANVEVSNSEQSNNTGPSSNNLAGQLATHILPVCTESKGATDNGKADGVGDDNRVVGVSPYLLLCCLSLSSRLLLCGSSLGLLLALDALGLSVGLDRLRLEVRGDGGDVGAVNVYKRVYAVVGALNFHGSWGAAGGLLVGEG